ncbi:hypothetical protein [Ascidiimonas aurantiaca]|uniref:hypothetical protein n=1 Tax=Ascidiimonas aurantiaca TaxID=1685432 RepID=UPI0030ED4E96
MKTLVHTLYICFLGFPLLLYEQVQPDMPYRIEGTWELINQYSYEGMEIIDTIDNSDGYRQIKMFYKGKVMWTRYVPKDSIEWFGYGSYTTTDSTLTETLEYGSASMMGIVDTMRVFNFELLLRKNYYQQITTDGEGNRLFSENYRRISN